MLFHSTLRGQHFAGFISAVRRVLFLTEHTGGAHSATWAELNGLWSKGLIKRRHTTCPLALHFVHRGFVGKKMRARFPTRTGDLQRTTGEKTWNNGNKRCGLKNCAVRRLGHLSRSQRGGVYHTHCSFFKHTHSLLIQDGPTFLHPQHYIKYKINTNQLSRLTTDKFSEDFQQFKSRARKMHWNIHTPKCIHYRQWKQTNPGI